MLDMLYALSLLLLCIVFIVVSTTRLRLHPFLALLVAALGFGLLYGRLSLGELVESINGGFGATIGKIGIVIIFGAMIGTFLELSGGALAIAERILKITGERRVPAAMSIVGYIVSIPVFADSGFIILAPLNKALSKRAGLSLAGTVMALALGLSISHGLVPPTPGPIVAAGELGADLGMVLLVGLPITLLSLVVAWLYATKFASRIPIDPDPDLSDEQIAAKLREAPAASKSLMPILAPILLIVLKSVADLPAQPLGSGHLKNLFSFIGSPIIALLIGVILSFLLPRKFELQMLSTTGAVGKGLLAAAIIVLITGAGGAFGRVLQDSRIDQAIGVPLSKLSLGIWLPFILAAAIKTAQGSSTVAIITTAGIMAPMMSSLGFTSGVEKALVVLAIGAGGMVVSHANDSFFWVLTQLSRMDVETGYKLHTFGTFIVGTATALIIWIASLLIT